jgi:hypothetical protein
MGYSFLLGGGFSPVAGLIIFAIITPNLLLPMHQEKCILNLKVVGRFQSIGDVKVT